MRPHIITTCECPPIPFRDYDWSAYVDGTMDADYDYERGRYVSSTKIGRGPTELDAIFDLLEQLQDGAHFDHAKLDAARLAELEDRSGCNGP